MHWLMFVGGEGNWQTWSWKIKTAVSGMRGVLADVMTASEPCEDRTIVTVLNDAMFVDDQASRELHCLLATRGRKRQSSA